MILVDDEDLVTIFIYVFHQLLVIDLETVVENTGSGELKQKKKYCKISKLKEKLKDIPF